MPTIATMMWKSKQQALFISAGRALVGACLFLGCNLFCAHVPAQLAPLIQTPNAPPNAPPEAPQDSLGRNNPRGTVLGFLAAEGKKDNETAVRYLNTPLKGERAAELGRELFAVLNRRLPANLTQLSSRPEGSLADLANPNLELIGTVPSSNGDVEIQLERISRGEAGSVWLFSRKTLNAVPELYKEIDVEPVENVLPAFLTEKRIAGIPLFEWIAVLVGLPLLYLLTGLLNRVLSRFIGRLRRRVRAKPDLQDPQVLPRPIRLLILVVAIRSMLSRYNLPLLQRQFWLSTAAVIVIAAVVWLFIDLSGGIEWLVRKRLAQQNHTGAYAILRLGRRIIDVLAIVVGVLVGLYHFGLNPTTALAGLGIGGIAVALAAQKTLENLIGGTSVILDRVLHVGDRVTIGTADGTVEDIGLRSTRIRTLARTIISLPNGQVANINLENITMRDKFWFHHELALHKGTTGSQMRKFVEDATNLIAENSMIERDSLRVSFLRLSTFSLDVEIFAYFFASSWNHFLEIQAELLLRIMELLQSSGIQMAIQPRDVQVTAQAGGDNSMTADANLPANRPATGLPKTTAQE